MSHVQNLEKSNATVSDKNAKDMLELYILTKYLKVEFATAVVHNSYYFHKSNNTISKKAEVIAYLEELIHEFLKLWKVKNWYWTYFNQGLVNCIQGNPRVISCGAGTSLFSLMQEEISDPEMGWKKRPSVKVWEI